MSMSKLKDKEDAPEEDQVNSIDSLIYHMGVEAEPILKTFGLGDADAKIYKKVYDKFDSYFIKRRNVIYERAKFNSRMQDDEPVDAFITELYSLAEHCNYGTLREEMIRDRIVVGVKDSKLSQNMQLKEDLTLKKAIEMAQQKETVAEQQKTVRPHDSGNVDAVVQREQQRKYRGKGGKYQQNAHGKGSGPPSYTGQEKKQFNKCMRCGREPHSRENCPAKDAVCNSCGTRGHYGWVCLKKGHVNEVMAQQGSYQQGSYPQGSYPAPQGSQQHPNVYGMPHMPVDAITAGYTLQPAFLGTISAGQEKYWSVKLDLETNQIEFKIDTGADVTVIADADYRPSMGPIVRSDRALLGPSKTALPVVGKVTCQLRTRELASEQEVYIIKNLEVPLLGRPAIKALEILKQLDSLSAKELKQQYGDRFTGLGNLEGEYTIRLKSEHTPFALTTPRRIAVPLLPKVKEELLKMVTDGVISPVEEPTDWCAGLVVVPKPNGKVRICVDLTKLNEAVQRACTLKFTQE